MTVSTDVSWEGQTAGALARLLDLPHVELLQSTTSTMDVAHSLARGGAPGGTLVLADEQTAGRGRGGKTWRSAMGQGIWMTLLERPNDASSLGVLSLRLGLKTAAVLDRYAKDPIQLKWPNDLLSRGRKLAGILAETRWRAQQIDWVAIGFGLNVNAMPNDTEAIGLRDHTSRASVLAELVPAIRAAVRAPGVLTRSEQDAWAERDYAAGRRARAPVDGRVSGIAADGALLIAREGDVVRVLSGSLILEEDS